jgi:hypothetical protein
MNRRIAPLMHIDNALMAWALWYILRSKMRGRWCASSLHMAPSLRLLLATMLSISIALGLLYTNNALNKQGAPALSP